MTIDELKVIITADTSALKSGVKEATKEVEKMSSTIQQETTNMFGDQSSNGFSQIEQQAREASNEVSQSFGEIKGAITDYDAEVQGVASKTGNAMATIFPHAVGSSFTRIIRNVTASWGAMGVVVRAVASTIREKFTKSIADVGDVATTTTNVVTEQVNSSIIEVTRYIDALEDQLQLYKEKLNEISEEQQEIFTKYPKAVRHSGMMPPEEMQRVKELGAEYQKNARVVDILSGKIEAEKDKLRTLAGSAQSASSSISEVGSEAASAEGAMAGASTATASLGASLSALLPILAVVAAVIASIVISITVIKKVFKSVVNTIKSITKYSLEVASALIKAVYSINLLIPALERVSSIVNKLLSYTPLGSFLSDMETMVKSLFKVSSELESAMGNLRGAFLTAFQPIYEIAIPALVTLVNFLTQAMSYIASFISMLTGKSVATMQANAKALYGQASATDKLTESTKEANKTLASFDELNRLSDNSKNSSGAGGGYAVPDFSQLETKSFGSIKEAFNELLDFLISKLPVLDSFVIRAAEMLNRFNKELNDAFTDEEIIGKVEKLFSGLGDIVNHFVDTVDFQLAGETVANGLDLIVKAYNSFMDKVDFNKLGKQLSSGMNGLVDNIDADGLGKALVQKWNAVFQTLSGFVQEFNWNRLGEQLYTALNSTIRNVDFNSLAVTFSDGVKGIFTSIDVAISGLDVQAFNDKMHQMFTTVDWKGIGSKLGETIGDIMTTLAPVIGELAPDVLQAFGKMLEGVNWQQLGNDMADAVAKIDLGGVLSAMVENIGKLAGGLTQALVSFVRDEVNNAWDEWTNDGQNIGLGILQGILLVLSPGGSLLGKYIFAPFVEGLCKIFGISSPAKEMIPYGEYIALGLFEGIKSAWSAIPQFFTNSFNNISTLITTTWNNIKSATSQAWDNIKTELNTKVNSIKQNIETQWNNIKSQLSTINDNIKRDISSKWDNIKVQLVNTSTSIKTSLTNTFNSLKTTVGNAMSGVYSTVSSWVSSIINKIREIWSAINSAENNANSSMNRALNGQGKASNTSNVIVTKVTTTRANGGFVDQGQLFIAREAGPELVGNIGNKTAVANNEQIIQGIKQGVKEALLEAGSGNNSGEINLYLDSTLVAKKVIKYHNDVVKQTGLSPLMV